MGKDKGEVIIGRFDDHPWKLSPRVREQLKDVHCLICGRLYDEHSDEEFDVCMQKRKPEI